MCKYLSFFLLAILYITGLIAQPQYDSLLHKSFQQRAGLLRDFISTIYNTDLNTAFKKADDLTRFANEHGDKELALEAALTKGYYVKKFHNWSEAATIAYFENVINQAHEQHFMQIEARAIELLAIYYWETVGNYEKAFEEYFLLDQLVENGTEQQLPDKLVHLYHIGEAHYFFADYRNAIHYFTRELAFPQTEQNFPVRNTIRNTLGLCYQHLGQLDSADYYFKQILLPENLRKDSVWEGIASGNIGYNAYLRGEYAKAIPLFIADIKAAINNKDWALASGSLMPLADIYFKQNRFAEAEKLVMQAREYVVKSEQYKRYEYLYPLLSRLYMHKGQLKLAQAYLDSSILVKDSLNRKFSALQLLRARQKTEIEERRREVEKFNAEKKLKTIERNILIGVVMCLFLLAVFVYFFQRNKYRHEQMLLDLQLQSKEKELVFAAAQLSDFAKNISEKNRLIESLEEQFGENSSNGALAKLKEVTILTEEEWETFRTLFSQVHAGFLKRLTEKLPGLTPAETRFMALAKLKLSNKDMAAVQGVSTQNIRTIWYRLRKKLHLSEQDSLEDLLEKI